MNRREWLKSATVAGAALALPESVMARASAPDVSTSGSKLETEVLRLKLRHTWTTTMSSSAYRDTLHVRFTRDGLTGIGEGAPIVRYHEDAVSGQKALEGLRPMLANADPWQFQKFMAELQRAMPGQFAAK